MVFGSGGDVEFPLVEPGERQGVRVKPAHHLGLGAHADAESGGADELYHGEGQGLSVLVDGFEEGF